MIVEVSWSLICAAGAVRAGVNLGSAKGDLRWQHQTGLDGTARVVARRNVQRTKLRLITWGIYVLVGVGAAIHNAVNPPPPADVFSLLLTAALLGGVVLLVVNEEIDARERREVMDIEARRFTTTETPADERPPA